MKFLADESVDFPIVKFLRENNISIDYITEIKPGITDDQVINLAKGIVLFRLTGLSNKDKSILIHKVILEHKGTLEGNFTVISRNQVRIKKLPA